MFKGAVKELMRLILKDIQNLSVDAGLLGSISRDGQYMKLWQQAQNLAGTVFKTIALTVVAIFILVECLELQERFSSNQVQDILKPFFMIIIKLGLAITLINISTPLLEGFYNATVDISSKISTTSLISLTASLDDFNSLVDDMDFGTQVLSMLVLFITFLGTKVAWAFTQILVIGRFVQIYLYTAVAPAPIGTLPNKEFSQIGKNFLKSYASICVQGCILVFVLCMFPTLAEALIDSIIPHGEGLAGVFGTFGTVLVMVGAIIAALKNAKPFADKVCGAA